jgi:hypothetical protein
MRANLEGAVIRDSLWTAGMKSGVNVQTLAGTTTMPTNPNVMNFLDPGGATRILLLPPEVKGLMLIIVNTADAAEDLTVKEDSNTTTIGTISQNEMAILVCNGTTWFIGVGTTT